MPLFSYSIYIYICFPNLYTSVHRNNSKHTCKVIQYDPTSCLLAWYFIHPPKRAQLPVVFFLYKTTPPEKLAAGTWKKTWKRKKHLQTTNSWAPCLFSGVYRFCAKWVNINIRDKTTFPTFVIFQVLNCDVFRRVSVFFFRVSLSGNGSILP